MKNTFACNESIIITISLKSLKNVGNCQLLPEKFQCVFRDNFKMLVYKGKPQPVGSAQATAGLFLLTLSVLDGRPNFLLLIPSFLFLICGMITYAAGNCPNMHVTKLSFSLNILCFCSSFAMFCFCILSVPGTAIRGLEGLKLSLLVIETMIALFLIYWLSKAICREHFNTLPIILLKEED